MSLSLFPNCAQLRNIQAYQAVKGTIDSYDGLVDLLESIDHFLNRLDIYTKVPPTDAMNEVLVKILVELLSTLASATKQIKEGTPSKSVFGGVLYYHNSMKRRKIPQEAPWSWREGCRGGTPKARSSHPGRGSDNGSADPRGRSRPFPEYEKGNGR